MFKRLKQTVNPDKVTDIASWFKYYNRNNLIRRGGEYVVIDPATYQAKFNEIRTMDQYNPIMGEPVKVFPSTKAVDAHDILGSTTEFQQLRALAQETVDKLHKEQVAKVAEATQIFNKAEHELLEATLAWKAAAGQSAAVRSVLANAVAKATVALKEADATLSEAKYHLRYIKAETGLLVKDLFYDTHSDKVFDNTVYRLVLEPTTVTERIVPIVSTEAGTA